MLLTLQGEQMMKLDKQLTEVLIKVSTQPFFDEESARLIGNIHWYQPRAKEAISLFLDDNTFVVYFDTTYTEYTLTLV